MFKLELAFSEFQSINFMALLTQCEYLVWKFLGKKRKVAVVLEQVLLDEITSVFII